jgi:uncharacterized protein YndB with AHSA1/START domain
MMTDREPHFSPSFRTCAPLAGELRHSAEKVWQALTDPAHLRQWAPFDADGNLGTVGTVKLTWVGTPTPLETRVTRADAPKVLECNDTRWELEAFGGGMRLPKCGTQQVSRELAAGLHAELREVLEPLLQEVESLNERIQDLGRHFGMSRGFS